MKAYGQSRLTDSRLGDSKKDPAPLTASGYGANVGQDPAPLTASGYGAIDGRTYRVLGSHSPGL